MVGEGHFALATPALQLRPGLVLPGCTSVEPEYSQTATVNYIYQVTFITTW